MAKLPQVSGRQAVAAFEKAGFIVARIKGSHHILKKAGWPNRLSIPVHSGKSVGKGLLLIQIEQAGLTVGQFLSLL